MGSHIQHINIKISKNLGIPFRLRHFSTLNTLKQIYYSLIYPYLHYGMMSWGNTYPGRLTKVQTKQNKCICCIIFSHNRENSAPYFKLLDILNTDNIFKLKFFFTSSQNITKCSQYPWSVSKLPRKGVWYALIQYQICLKS